MHHLLLFAKCPTPGSCKTRLIPHLGTQGASRFAHAALIDLLQLLSETPIQKTWLYTPPEAHQNALEIITRERLLGTWQLHPQTNDLGDGLGNRLCAAFAWIKNGILPEEMESSSVTFIGMDCFELTAEMVLNAAQDAAKGVAQILPARDGGYVLLSAPQCSCKLFVKYI